MGYVSPICNDPVSLPMIPSIHPSPPLLKLEQQLAETQAELERMRRFCIAVTRRGLEVLMEEQEEQARADDRGGAGSVGDGSGC